MGTDAAGALSLSFYLSLSLSLSLFYFRVRRNFSSCPSVTARSGSIDASDANNAAKNYSRFFNADSIIGNAHTSFTSDVARNGAESQTGVN